MAYKPNPIDNSTVKLSQELQQLVERLAENTHEVWAQRRMEDGWTYGPKRDDDKKQNPTIVPYADLPESEKEYDRDVAVGIIKAIIALGGQVEAPKT